MSQKYTALIIDLKNSRLYSDKERYAIQTHLIRILDLLNQLYGRDILRRVDFSAGDEMQGLFSTAESAYLFYRLLSIWLHPVKIRAGIGVGSWDLQIADRGTTSQDGKAYHNARRAINSTNDADGYSVLIYSGTRCDITLNTIIGGATTITDNLSANQNQLLLATELMFPISLYSEIEFPWNCWGLTDLLREKSCFDHEIAKIKRDLPLDHISLIFPDDVKQERMMMPRDDFYKQMEQGAFFITSGKQRGIQTELAKNLKIKRQTVARSLNSGNIYIARNMALTALYEMRNIDMSEEYR